MAHFDGTDDTFDIREVIDRIAEIEAETIDGRDLDYDFNEADVDTADAEEYNALVSLRDEAERYIADWQYGELFISDDYFDDYARELAGDIGAIDPEAGWPLAYIDWEAAADALKMDYTSFEFMGTTYWAR